MRAKRGRGKAAKATRQPLADPEVGKQATKDIKPEAESSLSEGSFDDDDSDAPGEAKRHLDHPEATPQIGVAPAAAQ